MTQATYSSIDLAQIIEVITKGIIGERCQQVRFSYGDELKLDFGEMSAYTHPKLKHLRKGSWRLVTRATPWDLLKNKQLLIDSEKVDTENELNRAKNLVQELETKTLNYFKVGYNLSLTLLFSDDYQLILKSDLSDDSGLSYWELFMPTEQVLSVGPGFNWECKSTHSRS